MIHLTAATYTAFTGKQRPAGGEVRLLQPVLLLLVVCIGLAAVQPTRAADTGWQTAGATGTTTNWNNFTAGTGGRLYASDDSRATTSQMDAYGEADTFSFGVPAGAQIDGIEVEVEYSNSNNGKTATIGVSLSWDNGTSRTANETDSHTGSTDVTRTLGGPVYKWGRTWSDTDFSYTNFQLRIARVTPSSHQLRVDLIRVKVTYTQAPDLSWAMGSADFEIYESASTTWDAGTLVCSGMSGLDLLKRASVTQPEAVTFLIADYRDDRVFSEALRMGVTEFIEKPFSVKALAAFLALSLKRQTKKASSI